MGGCEFIELIGMAGGEDDLCAGLPEGEGGFASDAH